MPAARSLILGYTVDRLVGLMLCLEAGARARPIVGAGPARSTTTLRPAAGEFVATTNALLVLAAAIAVTGDRRGRRGWCRACR